MKITHIGIDLAKQVFEGPDSPVRRADVRDRPAVARGAAILTLWSMGLYLRAAWPAIADQA